MYCCGCGHLNPLEVGVFCCDPFQTAIFIFAYKYRATKSWAWLKWPDNYAFPR